MAKGHDFTKRLWSSINPGSWALPSGVKMAQRTKEEQMKKRPSLKEINARMDKLNKQRPSKNQIEELNEVIRKINKENGTDEEMIPARKIAASDDRLAIK